MIAALSAKLRRLAIAVGLRLLAFGTDQNLTAITTQWYHSDEGRIVRLSNARNRI